jgi:hypothetical protein
MKRTHAITKRTRGAATLAAPFAAGLILTSASAGWFPAQAQGPSAAVPSPFAARNLKPMKLKGAVPGEPNPVQLIMRMVRVGLSKPFLGREVTLSASGRETEQWVRWDPKRGLRFDSIRPSAGDILIDNYKQSYTFNQRDKKWSSRDSLLPRLNGRIKDVLRRIADGELRTEWVGQEVVAGRAADIVRVFPPDGTPGSSRKFWIDRKTGVRLKMEEVAPGGRTLSSSYLLTLDLSPRFGKEDFAAPPDADRSSDHRHHGDRENRQSFRTVDEATQAGYSPKQPAYLPGGFALRVVEVSGRDSKRITQRYANGITVISLIQTPRMPLGPRIQEKIGPDGTGFVPLPRGDRAYLWRDNTSGLNLALIGNLPDDQMKRIAASVR